MAYSDSNNKKPHYVVISIEEIHGDLFKYAAKIPLYPDIDVRGDSQEEITGWAKLRVLESFIMNGNPIPDHIIFVTPELAARADEINGSMVMAEHWRHGLTKEHPNVAQYGLLEMVLAAPMVNAVEASDPNRTTHSFICADRLVAALFTVNHHSAGAASDANIITFNKTRALACVYTSELKVDEDEDDADDEAEEDG